MYSQLPVVERVAIKLSLGVGWAFVALSGVGATWFTGTTVQQASGYSSIVPFMGWVTTIGSLLALVGVVVGRKSWWLEWVGGATAGAGVSFYAIVPWQYLFTGEMGRFQQANTVAACLVGFVVHRLVVCWSHSRKLKRQHEVEQILERANE